MAGILLSKSEQTFILNGIENDFRSDGRSNLDYRPIELETDIVSHASGSARLRLANTDILVGVKTEIDVPTLEKDNEGKIEFFVDCSANATREFEGRGGEQLATSIANTMQRAYHSKQAFDLTQLCIMTGKQCWKLYVDILVLESGGNLYDAVSLAVKAALHNTRIPVVKAALLDGGDIDLQLSDDPYDFEYINVGFAPLVVTLCRVGSKCIVDPTAEEECCSLTSLLVGVTGNYLNYSSVDQNNSEDKDDKESMKQNERVGKCTTVSLTGGGSVQPDTIKSAIGTGIKAAQMLDDALGAALKRERTEQGAFKKHSYGFLM